MKWGSRARSSQYLPGFEKQTGIEMRYEKTGAGSELDREVAIHLYRVMQEALEQRREAFAIEMRAAVRLRFLPETVMLEVEDDGVGIRQTRTSTGWVWSPCANGPS